MFRRLELRGDDEVPFVHRPVQFPARDDKRDLVEFVEDLDFLPAIDEAPPFVEDFHPFGRRFGPVFPGNERFNAEGIRGKPVLIGLQIGRFDRLPVEIGDRDLLFTVFEDHVGLQHGRTCRQSELLHPRNVSRTPRPDDDPVLPQPHASAGIGNRVPGPVIDRHIDQIGSRRVGQSPGGDRHQQQSDQHSTPSVHGAFFPHSLFLSRQPVRWVRLVRVGTGDPPSRLKNRPATANPCWRTVWSAEPPPESESGSGSGSQEIAGARMSSTMMVADGSLIRGRSRQLYPHDRFLPPGKNRLTFFV